MVDQHIPNDLIPGEYGDYIYLDINADGLITNWFDKPKTNNFKEFLKYGTLK